MKLTDYDKNLIRRKLDRFDGDDISFEELGFSMTDADFASGFVEVVSSNGPESISKKQVSISDLIPQDQNGVSIKNIRKLLDADVLPDPELLLLNGDKYWIIEGHHRVAMHILAGHPDIKVDVCVNNLIKNFDW